MWVTMGNTCAEPPAELLHTPVRGRDIWNLTRNILAVLASELRLGLEVERR